ncbi:MAG TPA: hypothetical protein VGF99_18950 [Myxococcota bacterium]
MDLVVVCLLVMTFATTVAEAACCAGVIAASNDHTRRELLRRPLSLWSFPSLNDEAAGWQDWGRRVLVLLLACAVGLVVAVVRLFL